LRCLVETVWKPRCWRCPPEAGRSCSHGAAHHRSSAAYTFECFETVQHQPSVITFAYHPVRRILLRLTYREAARRDLAEAEALERFATKQFG
jgi:hypothetical protein